MHDIITMTHHVRAWDVWGDLVLGKIGVKHIKLILSVKLFGQIFHSESA